VIFSPVDLDDLLTALRGGVVVRTSSSGGRYATTCSYGDGAFRVEHFDEGLVDTYRYEAEEMRAFIARSGDDDVWLRVLIDHRRERDRAL